MPLGLHKPADEAGKTWPALLIGVFVAFGGVLFGYDTGTISGILGMQYWQRTFATGGRTSITPNQESLIVSILSAGEFFGALSAAPVADFFGRRWGLILSCAIVFNLGVLLQTIATDQPLFIAGRFFAGLGVGLVSAQVPMYQSETAPKWIRGAIVGCYQLAITVGLFLAAIVNFGTQNRNDSGAYRIPIAIQFAFMIIICGGMFILPETPRFLVKQDKHDKALKSLAYIRRLDENHPAIQEELAEVEANYRYEMSISKAGYIDCFKGTIGKRLGTGCGLQALQQLTGVNFIFYYGTSYFQRAGFNEPFIIQVVTNTVNVASTFPGLYLVERMGRRNLLLMGAVGMCVSQFIVAIVGTVSGTDNVPAQQTAIAFVCIYIFFFASSWGPVAWVVTGELFPLQVRAKCLSMTTASNWLLNFAIAFATPYMVNSAPSDAPSGYVYANMGSRVFFVWGSFCFICIAFVWFLIYETKGLSLEQVDELYGMVSKAWKSRSFRPALRFQDADEMKAGERHMSISEMAEEHRRKSETVQQEKV